MIGSAMISPVGDILICKSRRDVPVVRSVGRVDDWAGILLACLYGGHTEEQALRIATYAVAEKLREMGAQLQDPFAAYLIACRDLGVEPFCESRAYEYAPENKHLFIQ